MAAETKTCLTSSKASLFGIRYVKCTLTSPKRVLARLFHADLHAPQPRGGEPSDGKYGWLADNDVGTCTAMDKAKMPRPPLYLFVPRDEALIEEYEAAWSVPALIFSPNGDPAPGIVTTHDQFAIFVK